jgi:hypothetical protein
MPLFDILEVKMPYLHICSAQFMLISAAINWNNLVRRLRVIQRHCSSFSRCSIQVTMRLVAMPSGLTSQFPSKCWAMISLPQWWFSSYVGMVWRKRRDPWVLDTDSFGLLVHVAPPRCHRLWGSDSFTSSPAMVLNKIYVEAELWRVANLFWTSLALVDRWRLWE